MSHYYPMALRKSTLKHLLSGSRLSGELVFQPFWRAENIRLLHYLIEKEFIEKDDVVAYAHEWLMRCGREMYDFHQLTKTPPGHLSSPIALGYWLRNGEFEKLSLLGWRRIKFGHGETREQYEEMAEHFLSSVVEQMLAIPEEPSSKTESGADPGYFCEGCPVD